MISSVAVPVRVLIVDALIVPDISIKSIKNRCMRVVSVSVASFSRPEIPEEA